MAVRLSIDQLCIDSSIGLSLSSTLLSFSASSILPSITHPSTTNIPPPIYQHTTIGVYCSLLTGQEKRIVPFAEHISATVEMVNLANVRCVVFVGWK